MSYYRSCVLAVALLTLQMSAPTSVVADEFGSSESGLRCYTNDLLADLRTKTEKGHLKDLPKDLRTLISSTDTLAILIDYRKKESKMVVGAVKKDSSKVNDFKAYAPEDAAYELLRAEFPTFKK